MLLSGQAVSKDALEHPCQDATIENNRRRWHDLPFTPSGKCAGRSSAQTCKRLIRVHVSVFLTKCKGSGLTGGPVGLLCTFHSCSADKQCSLGARLFRLVNAYVIDYIRDPHQRPPCMWKTERKTALGFHKGHPKSHCTEPKKGHSLFNVLDPQSPLAYNGRQSLAETQLASFMYYGNYASTDILYHGSRA
eukprot:3881771-Amphidinium_carterae.1